MIQPLKLSFATTIPAVINTGLEKLSLYKS